MVLRQTRLRYAPSRRCGALEWVVTFPSILLSFWVCQLPQMAHPDSPVDDLCDFPEFIPSTHQYLLTVLSIWWALGQLLGSLVGLLSLFSHTVQAPEPNTGCMAADREFLLPDHVAALSVSALRESGLAVLLVHHGWPHARPLCTSFLCFPSL